ncbi:hypothetical protein ACFOY4_01395 [Actinomadura syzygii]|nr:hypothetical protein [Actinomadura syzygii]
MIEEVAMTGVCPNCGEETLNGEYVHEECVEDYIAYVQGDD